jgi:rhodanese-related sulfurtransferase
MRLCATGWLLASSIAVAGCASDVSTRDARALAADGALILDVRTPAEFRERHVPRAVNIPIDELGRRMGELGARDRDIVVYCHTGARSGIAVMMLRKASFTRVHNLGSIGRWFHEPADREMAPTFQ